MPVAARPPFPCPGCGKRLNVPDRLLGKRGKCPACKAAIDFPDGPLVAAAPKPHATSIHQLPGEPARWQSVAAGLRLIHIGHLIAAIAALPALIIYRLLHALVAGQPGTADMLNACMGLHLFILFGAAIVIVVGDWKTTRVPAQTGLSKWTRASAYSLSAALAGGPVLLAVTAIVVETLMRRSAGQLPIDVFNVTFNLGILVRCVTFVLFLHRLALVMGNAEHTQDVARFAKLWIGLLPGSFVGGVIVWLTLTLLGIDSLTIAIVMTIVYLIVVGYLCIVLIRWLLRLISETRDMILGDLGAYSPEDQEDSD